MANGYSGSRSAGGGVGEGEAWVDGMAALRSGTTRGSAVTTTSSAGNGGSGERVERRRRRRRLKCGGLLAKEGEKVEVIDLCDSSGGSDSGEEEEEVADNNNEVKGECTRADEEEEEEEDIGFETFVDFESDNSLPNQTVRSFLRDCLEQPKILCHRRFQDIRGFMEEATGIVFRLPPDSPYEMDHEDDTFCVDKGDKWLEELRERLSNDRRSTDEEDSSSSEDDDPPLYNWAKMTPVQRKPDLGLSVWKWTPQPLTLIFLDIYLAFCREKYVPPKPPPPPKPKIPRRGRKRRRKRPSVSKKQPEVEVKAELNQDNGVDDYITEFLSFFQIFKNMDVEDRLKGDIEARARRRLENKEEPKYSRELSQLLRRNHSMTTPVTINSRKPPRYRVFNNGRRTSDSEGTSTSSSSSSPSSKESNCSDYRVKGWTRKPNAYQRRKTTPSTTPPSRTKPPPPPKSSSSPVVTNGLLMMTSTTVNGTIKMSSRSRNSSTNRSDTTTSSSSSSTPGVGGSGKRASKIKCEVCRPPKIFAEFRSLQRHLELAHGSRKRDLITCGDCDAKVKRERMAFHKRYCRKAMMLGLARGIRTS